MTIHVEFDGSAISDRRPDDAGSTNRDGMRQAAGTAGRMLSGKTLPEVRTSSMTFLPCPLNNIWTDIGLAPVRGATRSTSFRLTRKVVERCILMTTDPGDLVLDPTCGSGTTAYVAEQWGRRWITVDTSRVALALARQRLMGARFPYYLLADSVEGRAKESELSAYRCRRPNRHDDIRHGFVYERVQHDHTEVDRQQP